MTYELPSVSFLLDHVPFIDIGISLYKLYKENQKKKFRQKLTHFITTKYGETDQKIFDILLAGFTQDYQEKVVFKVVENKKEIIGKKKKFLFFHYVAEIKEETKMDFWKRMEEYFHYLLTKFPIIEQYCNKQSEFIEPFTSFSQELNNMNEEDFIKWLFPLERTKEITKQIAKIMKKLLPEMTDLIVKLAFI